MARQGSGLLDAMHCAPAREAAGRGLGMGHVTVICNTCHEELRESKFYEPAHDRGQRPLTGWTTQPDANLGFSPGIT